MPKVKAEGDKWDRRFVDLATLIAEWSKDPSTKVGAVLVRPTVAALGYNGFPRGVLDHAERYDDRPTKYEMVVHAEMNALHNCTESLEGYTLYVTPPSALRAMRRINHSTGYPEGGYCDEEGFARDLGREVGCVERNV